MGTQAQISPLSADNRCLPGLDFHFTLPVAVPTYWRSGADHLVVSRQSSSLGAGFHFTLPVAVAACWHSGADHLVVSRQSSSLGSDFHFTLPVAVPASGYSGADQPVVSRQSMFARGGIPFHDTCSSSGQRILWCRSARCQPTIEASQGQNSISRYL